MTKGTLISLCPTWIFCRMGVGSGPEAGREARVTRSGMVVFGTMVKQSERIGSPMMKLVRKLVLRGIIVIINVVFLYVSIQIILKQ